MADAPVLAIVGLSGALVALLDPIPYVRDILRGRTRPYRATWLIWSALGVLTFCSQVADGGTWSVAAVGVQAAATMFVFALSIRRGEGGVRPTDAALLLLAAGGAGLWVLWSEPVVATLFVIAADAVGVAMMLPKARHDPWSETRSSYVLASASGVLSTIAVGTLDASLMLYPAYTACANGVTALVITAGRKQTRAPDRRRRAPQLRLFVRPRAAWHRRSQRRASAAQRLSAPKSVQNRCAASNAGSASAGLPAAIIARPRPTSVSARAGVGRG
jgi:hypothetical protein